MADNGNGGGGLYFVVGGLVVVVLGMVLYFGGYVGPTHTAPAASAVSSEPTRSKTVERTVTPDSVSTSRTTTTTPAQ